MRGFLERMQIGRARAERARSRGENAGGVWKPRRQRPRSRDKRERMLEDAEAYAQGYWRTLGEQELLELTRKLIPDWDGL